MTEIFPIVSGLVAGGLLGGFVPWKRRRLLLGMAAAVVLGVMATIVSGEYLVSWGFLLVDIPLVGICSIVGFRISRSARVRIVDHAPRAG
jgi:hypothetical protein